MSNTLRYISLILSITRNERLAFDGVVYPALKVTVYVKLRK